MSCNQRFSCQLCVNSPIEQFDGHTDGQSIFRVAALLNNKLSTMHLVAMSRNVLKIIKRAKNIDK